jgi:RimJ/RimL family protein N-acetyltransferase
MTDQRAVRIEPWAKGDLPLLERLLGDPAMMAHLGGPESREQIAARHDRYLQLANTPGDRMFTIVDQASGEAVGSVGYWTRDWDDAQVYETGWSVLPEWQGRGIARRGTTLAIERARRDGIHPLMYAFPSVDNAPSNALCRRLGFTLVETREFEYPPGHLLQCNVWELDLQLGPQRGAEAPMS